MESETMFCLVKRQTVEERRQEILETTCRVVIERGFAGTRVSDVAQRLGISSSLVHYHFESKESLLAEAFAHYARTALHELEEYVSEVAGPNEQLSRAIEDFVPEGSDDLEWMLWIDAWGEALRNPLMRRISQELDERGVALIESIVLRGNAEGEFDCPEPHSSAMRLMGLIDGLAVQFAAHAGVLTRANLLEAVTRLATWEVRPVRPLLTT
ncbi:MAG: TetR family transcriptional regulator C-terminal domain-containing protein [Acidobacteria bacterium]|nr:TetR family transcriptional regulator C-terminal domain-containing protein [Acidobacteriota bacterium]